MTQQQKIDLIEKLQWIQWNYINHKNLRGYILSRDEQKAQVKLNAWEKDFIVNMRCNLAHDIIKTVSPKQAACLEKIFTKLKLP